MQKSDIHSALVRVKTHPSIAILGALVLASGVFFLSGMPILHLAKQSVREETSVAIKERAGPFENLSLRASAAYVYDIKTDTTLYEKRASVQLPLASLTKLMVAATATDILPEQSMIVVDDASLREEGDSGLLAGERWRFADLLDLTLRASSNDGAAAIAGAAASALEEKEPVNAKTATSSREIFITRMNEKAKQLGLAHTRFLNVTGLDTDTTVSGGYGSARDVAYLLAYLEETYLGLLAATREASGAIQSADGFLHTAENTNDIADDIPGLIGSKTGYTELAGGNLAVMFDLDIGHPVAVVVLGSTLDGRFKDVEELVAATRAAYVFQANESTSLVNKNTPI